MEITENEKIGCLEYKDCEYNKSLLIKQIRRLISLGFSINQAKSIVAAIENAMISGGDGGGPYCDFEEAVKSAVDKIEIVLNCL